MGPNGAIQAIGLAAAWWMMFSPAHAQERPSSLAITCAAAAGLVEARGAVVLSTGPYVYERIVRHSGLCEAETTTAPAYLPTRDRPQCFVGYRCRAIDRGEGRSDG